MTSTHIRGSTWSKWDLHVHSPASFHWNGGARLHDMSVKERDAAMEAMVAAINTNEVQVFAVMDYWTFDGVLALREYCRTKPGALTKTVFPGIELRVQAPTKNRLNIHAVLSNQLSDQQLRDFLSQLKVQIVGSNARPLSRDALREYARSLRDDFLQHHGFNRAQLVDDAAAWMIGSQLAEVTAESFRAAMDLLPPDAAVVFQPWDTYGGLSTLDWKEHYTSAQQLFSQPDIFECKKEATRDAFVGRRTAANSAWFDGFWAALGQRPRLPVRGSDAHRFADYGKFQSELPTWIKAAPTFSGLLQAIKEPAHRSWLGDRPPKLDRVSSKPTVYIDKIALTKTDGAALPSEEWFDGVELHLNPDLVAVIGNKGGGKSALADIIALVGDTTNVDSFSFLTPARFRDKKNNRGQFFRATLTWTNSKSTTRRLDENPAPSAVERVRYVPQSFFERVCSGQSEDDLREFTSQVERVIFAHVPAHLRGDAEDLKTLLGRQEEESNRRIQVLRSSLQDINARICDVRRKTSQSARDELVSELALRRVQLEDLKASEPPEPTSEPSGPEEDPKVAALSKLVRDKEALDVESATANDGLTGDQARYQAVTRLHAGLRALSDHATREIERLRADAATAGLDIDVLVSLKIDQSKIDETAEGLRKAIAHRRSHIEGDHSESLFSREKALQAQIDAARDALGSAQLAIQAARERRASWKRDLDALEGPADVPTSIAFVEEQIRQIDAGPTRVTALVEERNTAAREIGAALLEVCDMRRQLVSAAKSSIDSLLSNHPGFSLDFVNEMVVVDLEERFFQLIKQVSGRFRGEDEGRRTFRDHVESLQLSTPDELLALASGLDQMLTTDDKGGQTVERDLDALVRKGRTAEEVLNLLYGFEYVRPRFTLAQGGQPLTQLSPGQRGAMLLLFFLLVEDSDLPIILDQPEENLDNQTVFSLLVPAIKEAKERRQIIMVTHNANLAVCCDAEQVIHATFDRPNRSKVTYTAGPIEDPEINTRVVDVLEGTRPAFDNRRVKYGVTGGLPIGAP